MRLVVEYVTDLVAPANAHRGLRASIAYTKRHREAARLWVMSAARAAGVTPRLPCTITFTRYGVRALDSDNLPNAFKAERDGIACKPTRTRPAGFFEIDDADPRFTWIYKQETVPRAAIGPIRGQARVKIEIEWSEP